VVVSTTTAGAIEPPAYVVSVDGGAAQPLPAAGGLVLGGVAAGTHRLTLGGFPAYCLVEGGNPRDVVVAAGDTARATFAVTCTPRATVTVAVTTTGLNLDADGYTVLVDGALSTAVGANAAVAASVSAPGPTRVALGDVAANCSAADGTERTVTAAPGASVQVTFAVSCRPLVLSNQLVFVSTRGGVAQLYAMNADGSGQVRLTSDSVGNANPQVSPDGRLIAHTVQSIVRVITTTGVTVFGGRNVGASDVQAVGQFSPDGAYLSIAANLARVGTLSVLRTSGWSSVRSISNGFCPPVPRAWSPDSRTVLYGLTGCAQPRPVYALDVNSGTQTLLTAGGTSHPSPAWSPSSQRIALVQDAPGGSDIYLINPDGTGAVNLTNQPAGYSSPQWSPDGSKIAFVGTRGGASDLWVMNADGGGLLRLTNDAATEGPSRGPRAATALPSPPTATATRRSTWCAPTARG
jgi:hypothetical protein